MADARSEMGFGVITPLSPRPQGPVTAPRSRRRPSGVETPGPGRAPAPRPRPIVAGAGTLAALTYMPAPRGPWRTAAKPATAGYIAALAAARLYLGVEYPTDTLIGVVLGFAI